MTLIGKENYKGRQNKIAKITRHKRSEKANFRVWIAKAITRKQGYENQITNTMSKWNLSDRL